MRRRSLVFLLVAGKNDKSHCRSHEALSTLLLLKTLAQDNNHAKYIHYRVVHDVINITFFIASMKISTLDKLLYKLYKIFPSHARNAIEITRKLDWLVSMI